VGVGGGAGIHMKSYLESLESLTNQEVKTTQNKTRNINEKQNKTQKPNLQP
jgi:hypothetical protein